MADGTKCVDCEDMPSTSSPQKSSESEINITQAPSSLSATNLPKPDLSSEVHVVIEYCNRCRWGPRATWTQTEILATFSPSGDDLSRSDESPTTVSAVTLMPRSNADTAGTFRVWLYQSNGGDPHLIHDRKSEGGFAEMKVLKQRIRAIIDPNRGLGHSDGHTAKPMT